MIIIFGQSSKAGYRKCMQLLCKINFPTRSPEENIFMDRYLSPLQERDVCVGDTYG